MTKRKVLLIVALVGLFISIRPQVALGQEIPDKIREGVDISQLRGALTNRYPWVYVEKYATTHPLPEFWTNGKYQRPSELGAECRYLNEHGFGADIWQFNPDPEYSDYNMWRSTQGIPECDSRPFLVQWETVNQQTQMIPENGPKDMDLLVNRQAFMRGLDFLFRNVILPNKHRYVTLNNRAVIYLWAIPGHYGNFASLLREAKAKYPVEFIGSPGVLGLPTDATKITLPAEDSALQSFKELAGFMEYALVMPTYKTYKETVEAYKDKAKKLRATTNEWAMETGKKYLIIPTFQVAFDDSRWPGRSTQPIYPATRYELEDFAGWIIQAIKIGTFDNIGPFLIWSELYEGGAIIPSQCRPDTLNTATRFVGCGTERSDIVEKFFKR